jgi:radical SAM protein with 4Fe4S-binding SPASM domain
VCSVRSTLIARNPSERGDGVPQAREAAPLLGLRLPQRGQPLSVVLKLAGETCNINCHYCYEKRKPYPSAQRLEPDTLYQFLRLCGDRDLRVELHGGEPLLVGRPHMQALLEVLRAHRGRISLAMQTNATLLDDQWLAFFAVEWPGIDLGISLDGPPEINDRHRVDYRERGSGARVEAALRRVERHGLSVGVIAVVTRPALGCASKLIDYFQGFGAIRFLKFSPCLDFGVKTKRFPLGNRSALMELNPTGVGRPGWATTPGEYAEFMVEAFEKWRQGAFRSFLLEPIYSLIQSLAGRQPTYCHFNEAKCAYMLTLYPDGRVGSCDELRMPEAELGHLSELDDMDALLRMATNPELAGRLNRLFDKCNACSYREWCRGGCLSTRLSLQDTPGDDEYCEHRIRLIRHVAAATGRKLTVVEAP